MEIDMTKTSEKTDFIIQRMQLRNSEKTFLLLRRYKGNESVVTIPDGVEKIGDNVFADDIEPNETITKIIIPDSVLEISANAFAWCQALKEIEFPKKLEKFYINFSHCPVLEEITVPDSVTKIQNLHCTKTLKTINVGPNITAVIFSVFEGKTMMTVEPKAVAKFLLKNPAYSIMDGFVVNKKYSAVLFRLDYKKSELTIPAGILTISTNTFYDFYQHTKLASDMKPVEKVIIPESVKRIDRMAFMNCNFLKEVVYEGFAKNLSVDEWAFLMCVNFHKDGREIICKDRKPKNEKLGKGLQFERIIFIHHVFKKGGCMNKNQLQKLLKDTFGEEKLSISTIGRDIDFLRDRFNAPVVFSRDRNGYYYTDLTFSIDGD